MPKTTVFIVKRLVPASALVVDATVDYRLMRQAVLSGVRAGRIAAESVRYAHPELLRAARSYSEPTSEQCPLCEEQSLVLVRYVFGPRLPSSGICVLTSEDFAFILRRKGNFTCCEVEVCPECCWNHLRRRFEFRGSPSERSAAAV